MSSSGDSMVIQAKSIIDIMNSYGLELHKTWPIRVWDHKNNRTWSLPALSNMEIIPTFWAILHQIDRDWKEHALKFSFATANAHDTDRNRLLFEALEELKPRFIQCLFSYINFFFTVETGYSIFHDELKNLKDKLRLRLKVAKKPKRNPYIEKLRLVRNHTVVHWGGPDKKHDIDSRAGRYWGFSFSTNADSLVDLEFGSLTLVGAKDRVLKSLPETHKICTDHLKQYDLISANLLSEIVKHLPIKTGDLEYVYTKLGTGAGA